MVLPLAAIIGAAGSAANAGIGYMNAKNEQEYKARQAALANKARKKGIKVAKKGVKKQSKAQKNAKKKSGQREDILGDLINLLSGPRSNVYGDTTKFIPGRGFVTDLSGQSKEALAADRSDFERGHFRAGQASEDYQQARNKLLTGGGSRDSTIAEITKLLALRGGESSDRGKAMVGRQALRMDQGAKLPQIIRMANEQSGNTLADILLSGRLGGSNLYQSEEGFRQKELMSQLDAFNKVANSAGKSGIAADVGGRQDAMATALNRGVEGVGDDYGDIAKFLSTMWPQASLQTLGSAVSGAQQAAPPMDLSWMQDLVKAGTGLASGFTGGGTTTAPKDQSRLI